MSFRLLLKLSIQVKLPTVAGKVCSKAAEKEYWRILYNVWGAEDSDVMHCCHPTEDNAPTVCSLLESICV